MLLSLPSSRSQFICGLERSCGGMLRTALTLFLFVTGGSCDEYEGNITFTVYNGGASFLSTFDKPLSERGCNTKGNFSFMTHGWNGSKSPWILDLVSNLTQQRKGCVIFMNYSYYSDNDNYFQVISHFEPISKLVTRKLRQLEADGVADENIFMFGFSFGGRIVIEAALNFGKKRIPSIDSKH